MDEDLEEEEEEKEEDKEEVDKLVLPKKNKGKGRAK